MFPRTKMMTLYKSKTFPFILATLLLPILSFCSKGEESVLVAIDNFRANKESLTDINRFAESIPGLLMLQTLLYTDNEGIPRKVLVEEIKALTGGRVIEIRLRDGVKFHDGRRLTADDVVASINRLKGVDKKFEVRLRNIKAEVLNSLALRLTSDAPITNVYLILGDIIVLPPAGSDALNGTGPFRFVRWLDNGMELAANREYFEGRPKLDKIIYLYEENERKRLSNLLNGKADLMVNLSPEAAMFLENESGFYVKKLPFYCYALYFNCESPFFRDKAVRRAVSMAIDRDYIIRKVYKGGVTEASHPFPPAMLPTLNGTAYQPKEAARLLREAGWRDRNKDGILEKNGMKLRFLLYYIKEAVEYRKVIDLMSQYLFEVGIEMEVVTLNLDDFNKIRFRSGNYDAFLSAHSTSDSINYITWHSQMIGRHEARNYSRYGNKEVDQLLEQLGTASDVKAKKKIYARMQEIFNEEVPAAFLYNNAVYTAVNKRFNGAEDFAGDTYNVYKIKDWSINEGFR